MDTKTQLQTYLGEAKPLLIEFYASWCPRCKKMMPIMDELRQKLGDKANILQIDVDENPDLAKEYKVESYPQWFIFKDGQQFWHDGGEKPLSELLDMVRRVI